jgi:hypothetical protein
VEDRATITSLHAAGASVVASAALAAGALSGKYAEVPAAVSLAVFKMRGTRLDSGQRSG